MKSGSSDLVALPFVFSAGSEKSLASLLFNFSQYLGDNPSTNLQALSMMLLTRRSTFTFKISFSAQTIDQLRAQIGAELERKANGTFAAVSSRPSTKARRVLGIFTGQGAQWPAMGAELIAASSLARTTLDRLESCLAELPLEYRPEWSLSSELAAAGDKSRVSEAVMSQPLCTALHIILVDHLRAVGISFAAVVGHSSGEIGAAYAAGFLSAESALKIAHLRGFFAKLAGAGTAGAMLAVGQSMSEAQEICQSDAFRDRVSVACSNSSNSSTLSGDADAIDEVLEYCEARGTFARKLKVDTAYHSHHMVPCSEPYINALRECEVETNPFSEIEKNCVWYSSVREGQVMELEQELEDQYWADNMLQPVLFSQAVTTAASAGTYDFVIEVGPSPALKGPASRTLQEVSSTKKEIPYTGLLAREKNAIETFASALGQLWTHLGKPSFSATSYANLFSLPTTYEPIKNLPTYPWDHERPLWYESRMSRSTRTRPSPAHPLLGIAGTDNAESEYKWRNYIRINELPWLSGHQIQDQIIFPAAGYVVMAFSAADIIASANEKSLAMIEIKELRILQAMTLQDDGAGVEIMFGIKISGEKGGKMEAEFSCHVASKKDSLVLAATGTLLLRFGDQSEDILPMREVKVVTDLRDVEIDTFYDSLSEVGYGYTDAFRGISKLQQKLEFATGLITNQNLDKKKGDDKMEVHPGTIDTAIQTLFACLGTPGDGALWSMHVPVLIRSIRFNPSLNSTAELEFESSLSESQNDNLCGDVTLFDSQSRNTVMQIEGIEVKPLMPATAADDRHLFHELVWGVAEPDAELVYRKTPFSENEIRKAEVLEMMCLFYLKQLLDSITDEERANATWHGQRILDFATDVLDQTKAGTHKTCKVGWLSLSREAIERSSTPFANDVDVRLIRVVGSKLIPFLRKETTILEHMVEDNLLNDYYQNSELLQYNEYAGLLAAQIAFRYPLMKILEIGAGTGGATRSILKQLDNKYSSYTFTDISMSFFESARETFKDHSRIVYEVLDIESDPTTQGFQEGSFDMVIASNVLHATKFLDQTMANARKLLKPGGKLLVLEAVDNGAARVGFSFCGVPGWWAGFEDGRTLSPLITTDKWDETLKRTGFSGVDTVTPSTETPVAVFVGTAVDEQLTLLRSPLALTEKRTDIGTLFIIGGQTPTTRLLMQDIRDVLKEWSTDIQIFTTIEELENVSSESLIHVLNLSSLDTPTFDTLTERRLGGLKNVLNISKSFLWVTSGAHHTSPYSAMTLGIGRTLCHEMPHIRLQVLDFDDANQISGKQLAETFLKNVLVEKWENDVYAEGVQWSNEVEVWVQDGKEMITRVAPEIASNKRLMSERRVVEEQVSLEDEVVEVVKNGERWDLRKKIDDDESVTGDDNVDVNVEFSTNMAIGVVGAGALYLVVGTADNFGGRVIALSKSLGSRVTTSNTWVVPWNIVSGTEVELLDAVSLDLMAQNLAGLVPENGTISTLR